MLEELSSSSELEGGLEGGGPSRASQVPPSEHATADAWVLPLRISFPSQSTYRCSICDLHYNTLASLRRHRKISHSRYTLNEIFVCDACGEEATSIKGIKSHQKSSHVKVVPPPVPHSAFPCPHCELYFPSKTSCSQHVRGRHMDEASQARANAALRKSVKHGTR